MVSEICHVFMRPGERVHTIYLWVSIRDANKEGFVAIASSGATLGIVHVVRAYRTKEWVWRGEFADGRCLSPNGRAETSFI